MNEIFLSHEEAANINRNNILRYVRSRQQVSRTDIWSAMNISRASVTQIIRQLIEAELLVETGVGQSRGGPKPRYLQLNHNARYVYAFDWNHHILCLVNIGGDILIRKCMQFPSVCTPTAFASTLLTGLEEIRNTFPIPSEKVLGMGLALPGQIDSRSHRVLFSVELGWRDVDILCLLADQCDMDIFLERTGNMIALGEFESNATSINDQLVLVLLENEGIGISAIMHGQCIHGSNYMFGELGHIKLPSDIMCSCGQQGCLEAIVHDQLLHNGGVIDSRLVQYLSLGISSAINLLDPNIVILTGKLLDHLPNQCKQELNTTIRKMVTNVNSRTLTLNIHPSNHDIGILGMSNHVFNRCFRS